MEKYEDTVKDCNRLGFQGEKLESCKILKNLLHDDNHKVYALVTHVSSSGMSRRLKFYVPTLDTTQIGLGIYNITHDIANLLDYPINDKGLRVDGVGMDEEFAVVYELSRVLYKGTKEAKEQAKILNEINGSVITSKSDSEPGYVLNKVSLD